MVFDIDNKIMFQSRGSYLLSYPNFFTEQKTLIAGIYTIMVKPMWEDDGETSNTNKADYRKILVGIYYPRNAEFGKLSIVDG